MTPRRTRTDMVRQYVITGGRFQPSRNAPALDLVTLVIATGDRLMAGLGPEARRIVELCLPGHLSLVEVASRVQLPVTVTRVLISDLIDSGHAVVRRPPSKAARPPIDVVERVLHGLERL